jgi:O-antigen ligase
MQLHKWQMSKFLKNKQIDLWVLVAGAVFIIPYLYSSSTIDVVLLPRFLAWSILTFVLNFIILIKICWNKQRPDLSIIRRAIFPLLFCYLLVALISLSKAGNLTEGVFECLKVFLCLAFVFAATITISSNRNGIIILTKSVVLAAIFLASIGICQYYGLGFRSIPGNGLVYATMAHKNIFASALFLMLPFVLYGNFGFSGAWRALGQLSIALIIVCIVLTETRVVWVAATASSIAAAFLIVYLLKEVAASGRKTSVFIKRMLSVLILSLGLIFCNFLVRYDNSTEITPRRTVSTKHAESQIHNPSTRPIWSFESLNERLTLWKKSLYMVKEAPLLGVGLGQWKIVLPRYGRIEKYEISDRGIREFVFQRPHNDYIWVLSETGVLGLACYVSFFLFLIYYALRIFFRSEDTEKKVFSILMLFGLIGYLVISFFSFPRERIFHNVFLMLMAACVVSTYHSILQTQKKVTYRNALVLNVALLLLLGNCIYFAYARLNSEIHAKEALSARKDKHWERVISEIDRANSRFYNMDPSATPLSWYRGMANFSLGQIREALEDFKTAYKIHPNHIHVLNNIGTCYALLNDDKKALEYYQKGLAMSPHFKETRINLKAVYNSTGR